jgi:hypothetical protein
LRFVLAKYERLEILSLLESSLWEWKIKELEFQHGYESGDSVSIERNACRVGCGAEIVIANVLLFLGKVEKGHRV